MTNTTAVLYFGTGFEWILKAWMDAWMSTNSKRSSLVVVTTHDTNLPECCTGLAVLRCSLFDYADVLRGLTMDVKEVLALHAMLVLPGNLFVVDADAIFQHCPWTKLERLHHPIGFSMVRDCRPRTIELGRSGRCMEKNAGILFFGENSPRERIARLYRSAFKKRIHVPDDRPKLLGQRAWSIAHYELNGSALPDTLNWSHTWGVKAEAHVFHYHGDNGKTKLRATIEANPCRFSQ